ncbi:MAG: hypothetical protein ABWY00_10190 [Dongiaceae bacterium]
MNISATKAWFRKVCCCSLPNDEQQTDSRPDAAHQTGGGLETHRDLQPQRGVATQEAIFIGRPSVMAIRPEDLKDLVKDFKSSVTAFMNDRGGEDASAGDEKWTARQYDTLFLLDRFRSMAVEPPDPESDDGMYPAESGGFEEAIGPEENTEPDEYIYACMIGHRAVGLLALTHHPDMLEIRSLVSHPGVAGAGEILMEKSVNRSESLGLSGAIYSNAEHSAVPFYQGAGLALVDPDQYTVTLDPLAEPIQYPMTLDPRQSNAWTQIEGSWHLTRRSAKAHLVDDHSEMTSITA